MNSSSSRPEHLLSAEIFYGTDEAQKYSNNTRIIGIQTEMTERALQILAIPPEKSCLILDIGCGSGISGNVLTEHGHEWIGVDVSRSMLDVAVQRETEGDLLHADIGQGLGFRAGLFDAAISISAIQWLCAAEKKCHNPFKRINAFFQQLYSSLIRGARCAFQFYPENSEQIEMITNAALKNGFTGGVVIDYPNSKKAKKYFLFLMAGYNQEIMDEAKSTMPSALGVDATDDDEQVDIYGNKKFKKNNKRLSGKERSIFKSKDWILNKKDRQRKQGKEVRSDSKYTGRKRPTSFT